MNIQSLRPVLEPNSIYIQLDPPIHDEVEPIFIVKSEADAQLLFQNLEILSRLSTREITVSYVREAIMTLSKKERDEMVAAPLKKDDLIGQLRWRPLVLCFNDEVLADKFRRAGAQVSVLLDIPLSLQHARDMVKIVMPVKSLGLRDMPETVLDGWLGELCRTRMSAFPIAFAWPALLTAASTLVPQSDVRINLYSSLVGPVGSGKSQAIEHANALLGMQEPILMNIMAGSAEGLLRKLGNTNGNARLLSVDELGHLLEKAQIEGASFPYILDRAYYHTTFVATMARGQETTFNCRLSLIGGVVDDNFGDLFGSKTKGGLHDRFIFGQCPSGFNYRYRPFEGGPALQLGSDDPNVISARPVAVNIHPDVLEARDKWLVDEPNLQAGRVTEHAIRAALVCAAFDGRGVLRASDLGPALEFARYQARIRKMLKPNPGETMEAIMATKVIDWLDTYAPASNDGDNGQWVNRRVLYKAIHAERFGHAVSNRAIQVLEANGDIETSKEGKSWLVRRLFCAD